MVLQSLQLLPLRAEWCGLNKTWLRYSTLMGWVRPQVVRVDDFFFTVSSKMGLSVRQLTHGWGQERSVLIVICSKKCFLWWAKGGRGSEGRNWVLKMKNIHLALSIQSGFLCSPDSWARLADVILAQLSVPALHAKACRIHGTWTFVCPRAPVTISRETGHLGEKRKKSTYSLLNPICHTDKISGCLGVHLQLSQASLMGS